MITSQDVRIILDRNRNGLDGRPSVAAGQALQPGVYWEPVSRTVVSIVDARVAEMRYVSLSPRPDVGFDELVRELAMGGGGQSGNPIPYHRSVRSVDH